MYTFWDFSNAGTRFFLWYNHKLRFSCSSENIPGLILVTVHLPSTSDTSVSENWSWKITQSKPSGLLLRVPAAWGWPWLLTASPGRAVQSLSCRHLQAPGTGRRAPRPLIRWGHTHQFGSCPALEPAKSIILGKYCFPLLCWFNLANPLTTKTSCELVKVSDYG